MELQQILHSVSLCREGEDERRWKEDPSFSFSVKSAYVLLQNEQGSTLFDGHGKLVFKNRWKCKELSKVLAFSKRLLLYKLPTRE